MVSTYLSFDLINRDMAASLKRISSQNQVANDQAYYQANIGKVSTIDEFLDDYRLYSFAMKAHGLEEMIYAKAFMKQVLESDLADDNSFANRLTDERYTNFAGAFNFGASSTDAATAQSEGQMEDILDLYDQKTVALNDKTEEETRYFKVMLETEGYVTNVDQFLRNDRLREYVFTAYGIDGDYYNYSAIRGVLTSDPDDPDSYFNTTYGEGPEGGSTFYDQMKRLAEDFQFNADGSVPDTGIISTEKLQGIVGDYFGEQEQITHAEAMFNQEYFESKVGSITNVDELLDDERIYQYLRSAFGLNEVFIVKSTLEQILTSDLSDPDSVANSYPDRPGYLELANAFNFNTDGTVKDVGIQTDQQATRTRTNYMSRWDDKLEEDLEKNITFYKSDMAAVETLSDFLGTSAQTTYEFALEAVGIDPSSVSKFKIRSVLQSDLSDPNSYVYTLKDERFISLAKLFNFNSDGDVTVPVLAQSNATITNVAKDYILRQTRFLEGEELEAAKTKAQEESQYYTDGMQRLDNRDQLLEDRKLMDILLVSEGIDPETITDDFLKQIFESDLNDPESYVNTLEDKRFAQIVGSFNFDADGEIDRSKGGAAQNGGQVAATQSMYLSQMLETEQGNDNPGVRLALYFQRMADTITDPYVILGDDALAEFFRVSFSLPTEFSNMDVDKQAQVIEKNLNLEELSDPVKLKTLVERFTMMYDLENGVSSSPAVSILNGGSGSTGISADTLWALAQLGG